MNYLQTNKDCSLYWSKLIIELYRFLNVQAVERQIWRSIFERDYPSVYQNAIGPGNAMKQSIKQKIDALTVVYRQGRAETYWKRYYEFLKKSEESIEDLNAKHYPTFTPDEYVNWRDKYNAAKQTLKRTDGIRYISWREDNEVFRYSQFDEWIFRHDPNNDTMYYYPIGMDIMEPQHNTVAVIVISMTNLQSAQIVPWNPLMEQAVELDLFDVPFVRSKDGFYWIRIHYTMMDKFEPSNILVSQPLVCSTCSEAAEQLHSCECCGEIYCGRECQKVNH